MTSSEFKPMSADPSGAPWRKQMRNMIGNSVEINPNNR